MPPLAYMKATYDSWAWKRVRVVAMPLPPIKVHSLLYRADSFASATFDREFDLDGGDPLLSGASETFRAISVVPSHSGPAVLISLKLSDLIGFDETDGHLTVHRRSCCASVSYQIKHSLDYGKLDYAHNVVLKRLNFSSSCNPGSHLVAPNAPHLTALLQYAASPYSSIGSQQRLGGLEYLSPDEGRVLFPTFDFSANGLLDQYIATCTVRPEVKYCLTSSGIGEWTVPYLTTLRRNRYLMENPDYAERLPPIVSPSQENGRKYEDDPHRGGSSNPVQEERNRDRCQDSTSADQGCTTGLGCQEVGGQTQDQECQPQGQPSQNLSEDSGRDTDREPTL